MNSDYNVHGIILAAGKSRRMGQCKQLLPLGNDTLLGFCLKRIQEVPFSGFTLVLGENHEQIIRSLNTIQSLNIVINTDSNAGMGDSIAHGVRYVVNHSSPDAIMLTLGDQPLLNTVHFNALLKKHNASPTSITACRYSKNSVGPPVIFGSSYFEALSTLSGDKGAKLIIEKHRSHCNFIKLQDFNPIDIDTQENYQKVLSLLNLQQVQ